MCSSGTWLKQPASGKQQDAHLSAGSGFRTGSVCVRGVSDSRLAAEGTPSLPSTVLLRLCLPSRSRFARPCMEICVSCLVLLDESVPLDEMAA